MWARSAARTPCGVFRLVAKRGPILPTCQDASLEPTKLLPTAAVTFEIFLLHVLTEGKGGIVSRGSREPPPGEVGVERDGYMRDRVWGLSGV